MSKAASRAAVVLQLLLGFCCGVASATTWYVRPDGGTRYSSRVPSGQCDGKSDLPYRGSGTNGHCAFKDVRYLWQDGSYSDGNSFPAWGWIIAGGDTVILRGTIADKVSYRIGWPNASGASYGKGCSESGQAECFGIAGDPYNSGPPPPPSGTPEHHTRILGEKYESCRADSSKTQIHGGFGIFSVLNMSGASYVDLACLDITDFSNCGRANQKNLCNSNVGTLSDYASNGISWKNSSTHDTLTDLRIHGLAGAGMIGPTGDGVVIDHVQVLGNASSGWNADAGDRTTGTGKLLVTNFDISWNGCAEEYPITDAVPYQDCTDDNHGGYGDGFGTTTMDSNPGWQLHFDHGVVSYNTQDGLDALHVTGPGSTMTVSNTLAYGNMGQQLKIGGTSGTIEHSVIFTNCNALRQRIPGTPEGYNTNLSDFCRAADSGVVFSVNDGSTATYTDNVLYSASATAIEVEVNKTCETPTCLVKQQNNIFIGFRNDKANGYPGGGSGEFSNPLYVDTATRAYTNPGSSFSHNTTFRANSSWRCPETRLHETFANCGDPHLANETWPLYGYVDVTPTAGSKSDAGQKSDKSSAEDMGKSNSPKTVVLASVSVAMIAFVAAAGWARIRKNRRS